MLPVPIIPVSCVPCAMCHQLTRSCVTQPLTGLSGEVLSVEERHIQRSSQGFPYTSRGAQLLLVFFLQIFFLVKDKTLGQREK